MNAPGQRSTPRSSSVEPSVAEVVRKRFRAGGGPPGAAGERIASLLRAEAPLLGDAEIRQMAGVLEAELVGLGPIEGLLEDHRVTDVLVNGPGEVWIERDGCLVQSGVVLDRAQVERAVERLVVPLGLRADRSHPIVDGRLADGTRVTAVMSPLAVSGPVLAVRRHSRIAVPLEQMAGPFLGTLRERLDRRRNVVVFGPTGSGKTTLLRSLATELPGSERVVCVEDVAELRLEGAGVVHLEARPGTAEGVGRVGLRELVRAALRLRPDRIIVGEVRGAEAADMVWALSTGHSGSMSTVHAPSPAEAVRRLISFAVAGSAGTPAEVVRDQVRAAVQTLVGVSRGGDGRRTVVTVHDVSSDGSMRPVGISLDPRLYERT